LTDIEKALERAKCMKVSREQFAKCNLVDPGPAEYRYGPQLADAYRAEKNEREALERSCESIAQQRDSWQDQCEHWHNEWGAEKKRADEATLLRDRFIKASCNLGAENARLREFIDKLKALKRYRFTNEVGGEYGRPYIFADDLEALTPSTPSHAGEIDPTHADYGCFKTRNEFPS